MHPLVLAIVSPDAASTVGAFERFTSTASVGELTEAAKLLHGLAVDPDGNAYQRVRAAFFAHAIYRYVVPLVPLTLAIADDRREVRNGLLAFNVGFGVLMILAFVTYNRLTV